MLLTGAGIGMQFSSGCMLRVLSDNKVLLQKLWLWYLWDPMTRRLEEQSGVLLQVQHIWFFSMVAASSAAAAVIEVDAK